MTLTTQRFVVEVDGNDNWLQTVLRGRRTVLLLEAPLGEVSNVETSTPLIGRPVLHVDTKRGFLSIKIADAASWAAAIERARAAAHPAVKTPPVVASGAAPPAPRAVMMHTIERQVVKVRCRHCGQLSDELPGRCSSCGAPL